MTDLAHRSATELTSALRRREIGSRELLDEYLHRVDLHNPGLNAIVTLDVDGAAAAAAAGDEAAARGEELGPLHGLPITVKDAIETAGMRTTSGAAELAGYMPATDATAVARLRAAGAIVFGKTNTPAWAGDAQTFNALFGTTNNPWDVGRSPGGSSGGSAAAVAAGFTGVCIGSDLGGSIRMPAGYCGVYGLRPTPGIVPADGHIPPPPGVLSTLELGVLGPLARSADDLDLLLGVLAGPTSLDAAAWSLRLPAPGRTRLSEYRIGVWLDEKSSPVDSVVLAALTAVMDRLAEEGARLDTGIPAPVGDAYRLFQRLVQPEMGGFLPEADYAALRGDAAVNGSDRHARWARMVTASARELFLAREQQAGLRAAWQQYFQSHDAFLCPVTPTAALDHDQRPNADERRIQVNGRSRPYWDQVRWTQALSPAHLPVAVVPVARTPAGLPIGLQVAAAPYRDRVAIDVARRIGEITAGYRIPRDP